MIVGISHIEHVDTTDHGTLILRLRDLNLKTGLQERKKNFCSTVIPDYKTGNMTVDQITKAKEFLREQNWDKVTAEILTKKIEEAVILVCDPRCPDPGNRKGNKFSSRN